MATVRPACNFCGSFEHFIQTCGTAIEYIRAGKCKRNIEGKIVLPSEEYLPCDLPGRTFKEKLDEWHRLNPGQLANGQMMYHVLSNGITSVTPPKRFELATRATHPDLFKPSTNQLSSQERIASLERELFQLKGRRIDPRIRTRSERQNEEDENTPPKVRFEPVVEIEVRKKKGKEREVIEEDMPEAATAKSSKATKKASTDSEPPIHPFAEVKDATYARPTDRNFATLPRGLPPKRPELAYRTLPPVYDGKIATDVYQRAMASQVTITQRELLSLSPEVRSQVREATSAKRTTNKDDSKEIHTLTSDATLPFAIDDIDSESTQDTETNIESMSTFINSIGQTSAPPPGSLIIADPYETYLKSLPTGQTPDVLVVAMESSALQSIYPLVDHQQHVEAIIDPGSQIIAMAEDVGIDLDLIYDPTIVLNMQSANGEVDKSLGLARNVPMRIGEITLYVQIHIIRSPAYDILLGRPFDILTESVVRNFANEEQTITIFDPNSGRRATVPTSPRGRPRRLLNKPSFLASRI